MIFFDMKMFDNIFDYRYKAYLLFTTSFKSTFDIFYKVIENYHLNSLIKLNQKSVWFIITCNTFYRNCQVFRLKLHKCNYMGMYYVQQATNVRTKTKATTTSNNKCIFCQSGNSH